eukprot:768699-Hanusia_phi.AAC.3
MVGDGDVDPSLPDERCMERSDGEEEEGRAKGGQILELLHLLLPLPLLLCRATRHPVVVGSERELSNHLEGLARAVPAPLMPRPQHLCPASLQVCEQ